MHQEQEQGSPGCSSSLCSGCRPNHPANHHQTPCWQQLVTGDVLRRQPTTNFSGVPPHKLLLRVGCPIILLRNLTGGLANGTRLIVKRLGERVIEAEVATGPAKGEVVCIPRLAITPSDTSMPFTLRRLQFPVRPAFAMTVNKSQGQTLRMVGLYLPNSVFSHGQLYVALSRVGRKQAVRVLVEGGWVNEGEIENAPEGLYTANVVYREVLT
jgi:ATP-dependent DNA helicase PIF1